MNIFKTFAGMFFCLLIVGVAVADNHAKGQRTNTAVAEAHMATLCRLNEGKTLADAEKLIPSIEKFHKEINYNPFFALATPLFVSGRSELDFIFMDWAPFSELSAAWEEFLVKGSKLQASIDKVAVCNRTLNRYFGQFTEYSKDDERVLSVNWCTKKSGVSFDNLRNKHRSFLNPVNEHILHWGIAVPSWGVREGDVPGQFGHFVVYPDLTAAFAEQRDLAQSQGWQRRADYFDSYADCSGENVWRMNITNIPVPSS